MRPEKSQQEELGASKDTAYKQSDEENGRESRKHSHRR
jgi:hypothetical protein